MYGSRITSEVVPILIQGKDAGELRRATVGVKVSGRLMRVEGTVYVRNLICRFHVGPQRNEKNAC